MRLAARGDLAAEAGGSLDRRASRARGGIWCARPGGETTRVDVRPTGALDVVRAIGQRAMALGPAYRPIRTPRCPASRVVLALDRGSVRRRAAERRPRAPSPRAPASSPGPRFAVPARAHRASTRPLAAVARSAARVRRDATHSTAVYGVVPAGPRTAGSAPEIRLERRTA